MFFPAKLTLYHTLKNVLIFDETLRVWYFPTFKGNQHVGYSSGSYFWQHDFPLVPLIFILF